MGGRLAVMLGGLLLCASVAGRLALPPPPSSSEAVQLRVEARRVARAALLERIEAAGLKPPSSTVPGGPGLEELAAGYSDERQDLRGAAAATAFTVLLAVLALLTGWQVGRRLDADLELVAARVTGSTDGALPTHGLAFSETVRLGESMALELPGRGDGVPHRAGRGDTAQQRSHLLASVSHDLRSPLNSVLGFTELLLRGADGPVDELLHPPLHRIRSAGKRQLKLVNQILEIARWQAGRMVLEPRRLEVGELLRDAVDEFRRVHEVPAGVEIETVIAPALGAVVVDGLRLAEALSELLGEALASLEQAAARVGPATGRIRLTAAEVSPRTGSDGRQLELAVEVPVKLRSEARLGPGTAYQVVAPGDLGLALPLARALVELHAGTLSIDDGPPPRLIARLPLRTADADEAAPAAPAPPGRPDGTADQPPQG